MQESTFKAPQTAEASIDIKNHLSSDFTERSGKKQVSLLPWISRVRHT